MAAEVDAAVRRPSIPQRTLTGLIKAYRLVISPLLGPCCRFHPTCSRYALDAVSRHGPWRGGVLALRRLLRCHPLHPGGVDPVPDVLVPWRPLGNRGGLGRRLPKRSAER